MAVLALSQPKDSPITALREATGNAVLFLPESFDSGTPWPRSGHTCGTEVNSTCAQAAQPVLEGIANGLQSSSSG